MANWELCLEIDKDMERGIISNLLTELFNLKLNLMILSWSKVTILHLPLRALTSTKEVASHDPLSGCFLVSFPG